MAETTKTELVELETTTVKTEMETNMAKQKAMGSQGTRAEQVHKVWGWPPWP